MWDRAFLDVALPRLVDLSLDGVFSGFAAFDGAAARGKIDFDYATFRNHEGFRRALALATPPRRTRARRRGAPLAALSRLLRRRKRWLARIGLHLRHNFFKKTAERRRRIFPCASLLVLRKTCSRERRAFRRLARRNAGRGAALRALEGGCRTIKLAAENQRDRNREQTFYRYELIARRHNLDTPRWERWASYLFDFASDYAGSIIRPVMVLAGLWAAFMTMFWAGAMAASDTLRAGVRFAPCWCAPHESWGRAMSLSAEMIFRPFSIWGRRDFAEADPLVRALLEETGAFAGFGARMLGTLESAAAVILVFLFALAIRRRFQIN
ncbi:MAG: hypothetical protein Tsb0010_17090 [Parvularculaceae bacterium]